MPHPVRGYGSAYRSSPTGLANFEDRGAAGEKRSQMKNRGELDIGYPERNDRRGMAVHDRLHLGMQLLDLAVNEAFEIDRAALRVDGVAVAVKFHNVGRGHQTGRHAPRQKEMLGVLIVARADMAKAVDHAL